MKAFTICDGVAAPLMDDNIDTDMIVRIERISQLQRGQFGPWAFEMWRYDAGGKENASFILNQPPFRQAQIILSGKNFGCGSSREMAVWALDEFGVRCVIAQSFGDIFHANCLQNGLLPIRLEAHQIASLAVPAGRGEPLCIDLRSRTVTSPGQAPIAFDFPDDRREALLEGIDEIDQTLQRDHRIRAFQRQDALRRPWIYAQS